MIRVGRREVVAQMLDYAANTKTSFTAERLADWLDESARTRGSTAAATLLDAFGIDDVEDFWQSVDTNLTVERLRLVFVADKIGTVRRIIEFLNSQMTRTEVLAIEVKQYTDANGEHQTIVPRVVSNTQEARAVKRSGARGDRLDQEALVARIREQARWPPRRRRLFSTGRRRNRGLTFVIRPQAASLRHPAGSCSACGRAEGLLGHCT